MFCTPKFRINWINRRTGGALSPAQMAVVYGLPKVNATRQPVIGIVELGGGYRDADNAQAFADMPQPVPAIANVAIGGAENSPGDAADGEVALDLQAGGGICQAMAGRQCKIVFAWAPNDGGASFAAAIDSLVAAGVDVISISWGGPEDQWPAADRALVGAAIDRATAAGITVLIASGDADASDGEGGNNVDFPACYPGAIGCGGTTLSVTALTYAGETAWNDGRGDGSGGGFSRYYPRPAYQTQTNPMRGVPDVCGPADPSGPGWRIILNGAVQAIGGTSAVAPMWAGIIAACKAAGYTGEQLAELLYANPTVLRDTTAGDNVGYRAGPGWDPCTGLGSPNGPALVRLLLNGTSAPPTPAPPPSVNPQAGPTLAQAQAAAVQGVEEAAAAHPIFAAIIRLSEATVRSRLAPLWPTQGDSMPHEIQPRIGLQGILAAVQVIETSLAALQQLLPTLQQTITAIGQLPVLGSAPAQMHAVAERDTTPVTPVTSATITNELSAIAGTFGQLGTALQAAAQVTSLEQTLQQQITQAQADFNALLAQYSTTAPPTTTAPVAAAA